ncbi:unnamed protein product [Didymodactylos carnosus]|uniref:Protein kinase domain-containing protein n=1 Tax=Didymodactylos carnosus TaxID=1234261 RepID=A0A814ZW20_9BILA|nr:unnamed protein product [Didymodactylos carnosus]CAF1386345.1 unnamed protein product [Didymodactylos carnosus]CAF4013655.1 unnamed protein product [Didymodactylos carnosus]CAF4194363.1 unnamed protein product [Didymodactylos carnosus]
MVIIKADDFENYYKILNDLGRDEFAAVKRVKELSSGIDYAAKFIGKKRGIVGKRGLKREEILREAEILSQLNHRNIITLRDVFENKHEIILVLELVGAEEEAVSFILKILESVHHMHEKKHIVHLDLKPENVMLLEKNKIHLKIIDFGISGQLKPNEPTKETFGTPEFVDGASPLLDNTNQETFANISQVDYRFDEEFFSHTKDFIQRLFIKNPKSGILGTTCGYGLYKYL